MQEMQFGKLKYLIKYPNDFSEDNKHPVIILLHGAGYRGDDFARLKTNPYFKLTEKHTDFPFVTVAPFCTENTWFDLFEHLEELVEKICKLSFVDEKRVYLMGASMGGYATWQLAMSKPQNFAAIVPICGGGMYWNAARLTDVPVWAFHGEKDPAVLVEESVKMVDAVNKNGGNAKLTIYPNNSHDAWTDTYSNWEVFEWLLRNKK